MPMSKTKQLLLIRAFIAQKEQGFTLLEVLVSILIVFFFILGSMQAMVFATVLRVQAQEKERANQLIQEDKEKVQSALASLTDTTTGQKITRCSATNYADGYAQVLANNINASYPIVTGKQYYLKKTVLDNNQGKGLGLDRIIVSTSSVAPHKILRIRYEVKELDSSTDNFKVGVPPIEPIATDLIEVIPNAALQCP